MKQFFSTLLTLLLTMNVCCQNHFGLKSLAGSQQVSVNGSNFTVDSSSVTIKTHYPDFDTLIFLSEGPSTKSQIICNFKPDTSYVISVSCCSNLDIIPETKFDYDSLENWDYEKDFGKIQNHFRDRPFISIRTLETPFDSIYAWHADAACGTEHSVISKELWQLGVLPKCFYWNNISYFTFFKKSERNETSQEEQLAEFLGFENIEILNSFSFRLFDDHRFVVVFDEKTGRVSLQYE
ncbi:MAG: hypothetical protein HRT74_14005 [Flavobacteriales bacterium]|nr:hypothetical protein [Flavobacteriales bacterium]